MGAVDAVEWACVWWAITFKMTEQVEQQICIKFCIKPEHSSTGTIGWFRRPQLRATGNWQLHHNNVPAHASHVVQFFANHQITQVTQPPLEPRFGTLWLLAFPKIKITFEKKRDFRLSVRFRKIWRGSWWWLGELCEVLRCLLWRGLRCHCPVYNVSCILYLLNKCLYFSFFFL